MEDEDTIREVLKEYMMISGYEVTTAINGEQAIEYLGQETFDLAVLDIMVPIIDGFGVLEHIRQKAFAMGVIMLTALEDEKTQVQAFNLYADDYVIKPVSPIILLKRMETLLRRVKLKQPPESRQLENGQTKAGLILFTEGYCAYYNNTKLPLTLSEYLLLQTLYEQPKRVFTREQLIMHIFNEDYIGNDRIIDAHVKNLRKKLPIDCIRTVIGVGYQYAEEHVSF